MPFFDANSTFAWYQVSSAAGVTPVGDSKTLTAASTNYTVDGVDFTLTLGATDGSPDLSDADGKVWYISGSTKTEDTSKVIGDTYGTGTITSVVATLHRDLSTYPTGSGDSAWAAHNTAANFCAALNSLAGKTITVRLDNTYGGTYDSQLKFKASAPTKTTSGWADTKYVEATASISAVSDVTSVTYSTFTGLTSNTYYYGITGTDAVNENAMKGATLTIKGSVSVA